MVAWFIPMIASAAASMLSQSGSGSGSQGGQMLPQFQQFQPNQSFQAASNQGVQQSGLQQKLSPRKSLMDNFPQNPMMGGG